MWRLSLGPTTTTTVSETAEDYDGPPTALTISLVREGSNDDEGGDDGRSCCRSISTISTADGEERQRPHRGEDGTTWGVSRFRCGGFFNALCCRRGTEMDRNRRELRQQRHQQQHSAWLSSALFALLGIGFLLPWNAFLSAADYFRSRLCSSDDEVVRDNFEAIFGFVYNLSAVLSLAVMTFVMSTDTDVIMGCRRRRKGGAGATEGGRNGSAVNSSEDQPANTSNAVGWTLSCTPIRSFHDMLYRKNSWDESSGDDDDDSLGGERFRGNDRGKQRNGYDRDLSSTESSLSSLPLLRDQYDNPIASSPPPVTAAAFSSTPHRQQHHHHRPSPFGRASKAREDSDGIGQSGRWRQRNMILYPLLVYLATFSVTALLAIKPDVHPTVFFRYTVSSLVLCGASSALVCAGVLDLANVFSPGIGCGGGDGGGGGVGVQSFVSGQGLAGLIVAVANLAEVVLRHSAASSSGREEVEGDKAEVGGAPACPPYETDWVAFASFGVGALVLLISIGGYLLLDRLPITAFYRERAEFLSSMAHARRRQHSEKESSFQSKSQRRPLLPDDENNGVVSRHSPPSPDRDDEDDQQPTPPCGGDSPSGFDRTKSSLRERSTVTVVDEELRADARDMELLFHDCFPSGDDDLDDAGLGYGEGGEGGGVYEDKFDGTQIAASKLAAGRYLARQRQQLEAIAASAECGGGHRVVNVISPVSYGNGNNVDETTIEDEEMDDDSPLREALLGRKCSVSESIDRRLPVQTPSPPRNDRWRGEDQHDFVLVRPEDAAEVDGEGRGGGGGGGGGRRRLLWSRIRFHALTCFVTFFVTLSLFPSWTYEMTSVRVEEGRQRRQRGSAVPPPHVSIDARYDEFAMANATDGGIPWSKNVDLRGVHNGTSAHDEDDETDAPDYYLPGYLFFSVLFLLFNLFDVVGRMLSSGIVPVRRTVGPNFPLKLLLSSLARGVVFYPLFLLCNHRRLDTERQQQQQQGARDGVGRSELGGLFPIIPTTAVVFDSDWYPVVFMILFALTNGLLISLALIHAPTVTPRKEQALGATVMTFAMNLGLFLGSMFSFLVLRIGTGEW